MLLTEFIELYPQFKYSLTIESSLDYNIKTIDDFYWWPFRWACSYGEQELIQKFIDLGVVINFESKNYCTGLEKATFYGKIEVVKLLLQKGANVHCNDNRALHWAVKYKQTEVIKVLLKCYSPNYLVSKKLHKIIDNIILEWYYNYIHKIRIVQRRCKYFLHKPGGPFFLNGLKNLI